MKHFIILLALVAGLMLPASAQKMNSLSADTLINRMAHQFSIYPQEKLHLHIDKPTYASGDTLWFKIYPVHATFHIPYKISRYVYTELINPLDSLIARVKTRMDDACCHGYIPLVEDLPDGNYTLRAYTMYMRNSGDDYFFSRSVQIVSPEWRNKQVLAKSACEKRNTTELMLRFEDENGKEIIPRQAKALLKREQSLKTRIEKGRSIKITSTEEVQRQNHAMQLQLTSASGNHLRKFFTLTTDNEPYDVSFCPEGGYLLTGTLCRVAFKAIGVSGHNADIQLEVVDSRGEKVVVAQTFCNGMGYFDFTPAENEEYTARCTNKYGFDISFKLPQPQTKAYSLKVEPLKKFFQVHACAGSQADPEAELYLIAHVRGAIVFAGRWKEKGKPLAFDRNLFPAGVIQFLLLDGRLNSLSERLAFSSNYKPVNCKLITNHAVYGKRQKVDAAVCVTDRNGKPLKGSFSVAVTDAGTVAADTSYSLPATLLLTSELKGYIENPSFYLQPHAAPAFALDLLMMTQGWRRYALPDIIWGILETPAIKAETYERISGKVETRHGLVKSSDKHAAYISGIARGTGYKDMVMTNRKGEFCFDKLDFSEGTGFRIEAIQSKGKKTEAVSVNEKEYPRLRNEVLQFQPAEDTLRNAQEADYDYFRKIGDRHFLLNSVEVKPPYWGSTAYEEYTEEKLSRYKASDLWDILEEMGFEITTQDYTLSRDTTPKPREYVSPDLRGENELPFEDVVENDYNKAAANPILQNQVPTDNFSTNRLRYQGNYVVAFVDNIYAFDNDVLNYLTAGDIEEMTFVKDVSVHTLNELICGDRNWLLGEITHKNITQVLFNIPRNQKTVPVLNIKTTSGFDSRFFGWYSNFFDKGRLSRNKKTIFPLGYQLPVEFYSPRYETGQEKERKDTDIRTTIFWKPDMLTGLDGLSSFSFYTSDMKGEYAVVIEGVSNKGDIVHKVEKIKID